MSRARRSPRIVVVNGSFGTCVSSTTSIVFTDAEVDMSCSILQPLERKVRWPRLSEQFFRVDKWSLCRG